MPKAASSRPEPDNSLYPSRLGRKQINPWIPIPLEDRVRRFLAINRPLKLQDLVTEALEKHLDEIGFESARAAVQPCSRAVDDQIPDPDRKQITETDRSNLISDDPGESARAAVQLDERVIAALRSALGLQAVETWFAPLQWEANGDSAVILAPNRLVMEWVSREYKQQLSDALLAVGVSRFSWECHEPERVTPPPINTPSAARLKDELLNYYAVVTSNRVRHYDLQDFALISHCSIDSIRSGILQSQIKVKGGKVRKFKYCVAAILQIEKAGLGPHLLPKLEREWQQTLPGFGAEVFAPNFRKE